jgi:hypothetical protein
VERERWKTDERLQHSLIDVVDHADSLPLGLPVLGLEVPRIDDQLNAIDSDARRRAPSRLVALTDPGCG